MIIVSFKTKLELDHTIKFGVVPNNFPLLVQYSLNKKVIDWIKNFHYLSFWFR
jgi:hypothetical protein